MPRIEKYFVGPGLLSDIRQTISRVAGVSDKSAGGLIPSSRQDLIRQPRHTKFFRLTEDLFSCDKALGNEVKITIAESCGVEFEDVPSPPDGVGLVDQQLFDVSYAVRLYNVAIELDDIETAVPQGTIVEATRQQQNDEDEDGSRHFWRVIRVIACECGSSSSSPSSSSPSSSSSSSSDPSSSSSPSGSDKSSAIVPASWTPGGYTALFIEESPEVRFDDVIEVTVPQEYCCIPIDPRFIEVCEKGSIRVCGCVPDKPVLVGASVEDGSIAVQFDKRRPKTQVRLVLRITGIRRGFAGMRFPSRSRRQFVANEKFINSAYPAE